MMYRAGAFAVAVLLPFACSRTPTSSAPIAAPSTEASTSLVVPQVTKPTAISRRRMRGLAKPDDRNFDAQYQLVAHPDAAAANEINTAIDAELRSDESAARTAKLRSYYAYCTVQFPQLDLVVVRCEVQRNDGAPMVRVETRERTWQLRDGHARPLQLPDLFVPGADGPASVEAACREHLRMRGHDMDKVPNLAPLLRFFRPANEGLVFQFQSGEIDDEPGEGPTCVVRWPSIQAYLRPGGPITAIAQSPATASASAKASY